MKIKLDYPKKRVLLNWLSRGEIKIMDMPELNNNSDNAFLELMKELPDLEDEGNLIGDESKASTPKKRATTPK